MVAEKAYASAERSEWLERLGIHNGIVMPGHAKPPAGEPGERTNRFLSGVRRRIEKIFGHWKRSVGYRRMRYVVREPNRLEL